MKPIKLCALACASAFFLAVTGCEQDLDAPKKTSSDVVQAENSATPLSASRYLIIASSNKLPSAMANQVAKAGGSIVQTIPEIGVAIAQSDDRNFAKKASKISGVRSVVPDVKVQWIAPTENVSLEQAYGNPPNSGDDDVLFDLQWGHDAVDAPEAWNAGYRGKGVRVAVLDTGFDLTHPDLTPNIDFQASRNFVEGEELQYNLPDPFSHGTHTAGTIAAADNGLGTIGVAPEATLILIKVLGDEGSGSFADVNAGIVYAADAGADVISMSLGAYFPRNGFVDENGVRVGANVIQELIVALQRAINYAYQKGTTIIASAGNDAINGQRDKAGVHIPSDLAHVINISATAPEGWAVNPNTNLDLLASYSNYGNKVDFAAPGGDFDYYYSAGDQLCTVAGIVRPCYVFDFVFSTGSLNAYYWSVGTSMAAPHTAGVAAIIIGKNGGDMHPAQVEAVMKKSADDIYKPGKDPLTGHGRVNAYNAVAGGV